MLGVTEGTKLIPTCLPFKTEMKDIIIELKMKMIKLIKLVV